MGIMGNYYSILGLYRNNGEEHKVLWVWGLGGLWGSMGIMEKKMETTTMGLYRV